MSYFTQITGITNTIAANTVDSTGVVYSGSNPFPITGSVAVSGVTGSIGATILNGEGLARDSWVVSSVTASTQSAIIDSSGVQYSGSNPIPNTPYIVARTTNPTPVGDGNKVSVISDDIGRAVTKPLQVRDLIATAYASFSTGTEATLLAATAGAYNDLIWILASNNSTAAVGIDIRAVTAGSILMHLEIPANSTTGIVTPAVPLFGARSDASGNAWTVDLPDVTGTTVYVSALFSQEV